MYFSLELFSECYKLLADESDGKLNQERTSALAYFLAADMLQHQLSMEVVSIPQRSEARKTYTKMVTKLLVFDKNNDNLEYQANHLGHIMVHSDSIATKTGKNFLSTQVIRASESTKEADYPTRPAGRELLVLGIKTGEGRFGIKKHINWKKSLMEYIDFRLCGRDTFPLIVFLLRSKKIEIEDSIEEAVRTSLSEEFTGDVVDFLLDNAVIEEKGNWFSNELWKFKDLSTSFFKYADKKDNLTVIETQSLYEVTMDKDIPRNRIIYGAPGTGKSYKLNKDIQKYFPDEELYYRVTFHQNYTYSQFIGTYKPIPLYRETTYKIYNTDKKQEMEDKLEPIIEYRFVPGPFLDLFVKSYQNPDSSFVLVIEEINRANAASVFGDVFQLLDRTAEGLSEYSIRFSTDIMNYLRSEGIDLKQVKIPSNFFIWATMNSADQGVTPIDTAFKRRWSFEYLALNANEAKVKDENIQLEFIPGVQIPWNFFRRVINNRIKDFVPEDKLIGPFFLKPYELKNPSAILNKLLFYLREDVLRHNPEILFLKKTFSDISEDYYSGKNIFNFSAELFDNEK